LASKKALVIEDDADVRENVVELLTEEGFDAIGAEDGERGIELAREHRPALIVCDVQMPKLDGYQVVSLVRADPKMRGTPFIFLSGSSDRRAVRTGMNLGADDYLPKPFSRVDLLEAIRSRLERQQAGPSTVGGGVAQAPADVKHLPPLLLGKYKPVRLVAHGGMGAVYEVEHANTGERLALKVMLNRTLVTPGMLRRFQREARAAAAIKSEHIVRVTDADVAPELDGAPFLVMELLEGENFEDLAAARGRVQPPEVVEWLRPIARTLDKAHRLGIVHRDLKPENLFLARREEGPPIVKILDFGIAKVAEEGNETVSGQVLGTPRYMAPEQAGDAKEVTAASDRFSLGLIAFRLLVGAHYYEDESVVRLLLAAEKGPDAAPSARGSDLGEAFDDWFARACAKDPKARFESASEQVEELASALGVATQPVPAPRGSAGQSIVVRPQKGPSSSSESLARATTVGAVPRPPRSGTWWWGIAAVVAIGGGALVLRSKDVADGGATGAAPVHFPSSSPSGAAVASPPPAISAAVASPPAASAPASASSSDPRPAARPPAVPPPPRASGTPSGSAGGPDPVWRER